MNKQLLKLVAPTVVFGTVALIVVAAAPTTAEAQTVSGCYVPVSGTVYRIKEPGLPDSCRSAQHVEFTWSSTGATGPVGPQGPAGPQGPPGPAGTISSTSISIVSTVGVPVPPSPPEFGWAVNCPAGSLATGGGFRSASTRLLVTFSGPIPGPPNGGPVGWQVNFMNPTSTPEPVSVYAVCVQTQ